MCSKDFKKLFVMHGAHVAMGSSDMMMADKMTEIDDQWTEATVW